jgi:bifunctional ADP-heptose synthase (sugar kinase/adenylyltransferase)
LTPDRALGIASDPRRLKIVTGYFDVLLAGHVRRLKSVAGSTPGAKLMVILNTPPDPVLPLRARAELVAALAVVDYVVPVTEGHIEELLRQFCAEEIVQLEAADERCIRELVRHVHRRQTE